MWKIWLIISGMFIILEIFTVGFLVFWFAVGALIAMVASFFIKNVIIQSIIFIISSVILLFSTKKFVEKVTKKSSNLKTNAYSVKGQTGIVLKEINSKKQVGQVKVNGEIWSAITNEDTIIEKDSNIIVEEISGVKLIVKKIN